MKVVCNFVLFMSVATTALAGQLDKATVLRLLEQHEQESAASAQNHVSFNSVTFGLPRVIFLDPDTKDSRLKRLGQANLEFYRLLASKGLLKEESNCNVPHNQFAPRRQYYCFVGQHIDFRNVRTGDLLRDRFWVVVAKPVFNVGSISTNGNEADGPVEIKMSPSQSYPYCVAFAAQMDEKYSDLKDSWDAAWTQWKSPIVQEQSRPRMKNYYFVKFDDGWRLRPM